MNKLKPIAAIIPAPTTVGALVSRPQMRPIAPMKPAKVATSHPQRNLGNYLHDKKGR